MQNDLEKMAAFIKSEFPADAGEISDALELLDLALDGLHEHASMAIAQSTRNHDYTKSGEMVAFCEEISKIQSEIVKWSVSLQGEEAEAEEADDEGDGADETFETKERRAHADYAAYAVDESILHTLLESFTYRRVCAFSFRGQKYPVKDWRSLLLKTCSLLNGINADKMKSFVNDRSMVGSRVHYFKTEHVPHRNERIEGTDLYVWVNLSANGIRNIVRKMLKKYDIPLGEYLVYLRADYTPLHPKNRINSDINEEPADDDKVGEHVRNTMRNLAAQGFYLTKADLALLKSGKGSKKLFDINYPFLKEYSETQNLVEQIRINGYGRYWKEIFTISGQQYLITSQWFKQNRKPFDVWLQANKQKYRNQDGVVYRHRG